MSSQKNRIEYSVVLGGITFPVEPMPWREQRRLCVSMYEVGAAIAAGKFTDEVLGSLTEVLAVGLKVDVAEIEGIETNVFEISQAFQVLMRATGLEQQMDQVSGEMGGRNVQAQRPTPLSSASETDGTTSTQEPPLSLVGPGPSSTK